jgi:hypothetical protein
MTRERRRLVQHATATWRCFEALLEPATGLPADYIAGDLQPSTRALYTSPTNIAMYVWAALAARDLGILSAGGARARLARVLERLDALERHTPSGQFYNWYDVGTGARLTRWPEPPHARVFPFASSVDNGWLACALAMLASAVPELGPRARALLGSMNFRSYYDAGAKGSSEPGLLRGGFWRAGEEPRGSAALPRGDYAGLGESVVYTGHHYGAFNTEPRIASYLAIALGQVPPEHYFAGWRCFPNRRDWAQKAEPEGDWRSYRGVPVFEGTYAYRGRRFVPSWGGSMFEALMPALVVPEKHWGPHSWGINHALYVEAQIEFGLTEARYGYWGFSPASDPAGGYAEYGVPALGMSPEGYAADAAHQTLLPAGAQSYGEGVVTPHAVLLALAFAPEQTLANLAALERDFPGVLGPGGFKDTVNVATGRVADRYLALDQGMVLAAIANHLREDCLQSYLTPLLRPALEPLMALERFGAGRA